MCPHPSPPPADRAARPSTRAGLARGVGVCGAGRGTARDIAGRGSANPLAVLSAALRMLEYVGEHKVKARIERAVWDVLEEGKHLTGDLGGSANTAGFSDAIIDKL